MRILPASAFMLLLAACHHQSHQGSLGNEASSPSNDGIKGVHRDQEGKPAVNVAFEDSDGKPMKLADFKGRPVLVNLWATWCAPCVKELPTLDRLARTSDIQVAAVSQDSAPHASVLAFLKAHQIMSLKAYQDPKMNLSGALGADTVLPTSILVDANGKEVWRYAGDLDWTSAPAAKLLAEADGPPKRH